MPFNAAALPGGWHYNGDVGRSCCCCMWLLLLLFCSSNVALQERCCMTVLSLCVVVVVFQVGGTKMEMLHGLVVVVVVF